MRVFWGLVCSIFLNEFNQKRRNKRLTFYGEMNIAEFPDNPTGLSGKMALSVNNKSFLNRIYFPECYPEYPDAVTAAIGITVAFNGFNETAVNCGNNAGMAKPAAMAFNEDTAGNNQGGIVDSLCSSDFQRIGPVPVIKAARSFYNGISDTQFCRSFFKAPVYKGGAPVVAGGSIGTGKIGFHLWAAVAAGRHFHYANLAFGYFNGFGK